MIIRKDILIVVLVLLLVFGRHSGRVSAALSLAFRLPATHTSIGVNPCGAFR